MSWAERIAVKVGDRVAVSARWLRSTAQYTGEICFARGTVTELRDLGGLTIASVAWDGSPEDVPERMNVRNLSRVTERGVLDHDRRRPDCAHLLP
ncbi:MAG: hypothetical protein U0840_04140 [Gemmataceae bacterium]